MALFSLLQAWKYELGFKIDESFDVLVPSFTFVGTINAICMNNLRPVFIDIDENFLLDLNKIKYLADFAKPLNVIIHKAIDLTSSPVNSLKKLLEINNVNGVLSSGGCETAELGIEVLKKMINISPNDFEIISAGKITNQNFKILHEKIDGKFYHGRKIVGEL